MNLLQALAIYLSFFCIVPWYSFKKREIVHENIFKCYSGFVTFLVVVLSLSEIFGRINVLYPAVVNIFVLEDVLLEIAGLSLFVIFALRSSSYNMRRWEEFFVKIQKIAVDCTGKKRLTSQKALFLFALGNIFLVSLFIVDFAVFSSQANIYLYFISTLIFRYVEFIAAYTIFSFVFIIKYRYEEVNSIWHWDSTGLETIYMRTLRNTRKLFLEITETARMFSKLFGWSILWIHFYSFVQILNCLFVVIRQPAVLQNTTFNYKIMHLLYALEVMVWLMAIIFCCDSVIREVDMLLANCYRLEQNLPLLSKELEELESLKRLIKNKRPKLTAAGFFEIKRSTLLSLLGTTTTYFIVALQFNSL